jgi:hypothetical protein
MSAPISPWAQPRFRDRDKEAAKLKARFAAVSGRSFPRRPPQFLRGADWSVVFMVVALGAVFALVLYRWSWNSNLRSANQVLLQARTIRTCDDARRIGIAPLYSGYAGYREHLDRDRDGIACEPYPF